MLFEVLLMITKSRSLYHMYKCSPRIAVISTTAVLVRLSKVVFLQAPERAQCHICSGKFTSHVMTLYGQANNVSQTQGHNQGKIWDMQFFFRFNQALPYTAYDISSYASQVTY